MAIIRAPKIPYTIWGFVLIRSGPGRSPCSVRAPNNNAVVASPGMPKVIRGTIAPPIDALLAASEAMIPSIIPVPNFSGYLELFFAARYETILESPGPTPGIIPISVPIMLERSKFHFCLKNSAQRNPKPLME